MEDDKHQIENVEYNPIEIPMDKHPGWYDVPADGSWDYESSEW